VSKLGKKFAVSDTEGMTLVEVVVAVSIMGIVATAAVAFIMTSIISSATHQRGQIAITIANQAMENASAQSAATNPITSVSYLLEGRFQHTVQAAWAANAGIPGELTTYPGWDPTATASVVPALPVTSTVTRSGTDYLTTTLIGTCYQPMTGGDCSVLAGVVNNPTTAPADFTALLRVIVIVSWTAGANCQPTACTYQTASLVDPHPDLQWNIH